MREWFLEQRENLIFGMLAIFLSAWLYTEVTEYIDRDAFVTEVNSFMHEGERFTVKDGEALEARLEALENAHESD